MNGNRLLLDTNTVLFVLGGDETLATFLNGKTLYLSVISELELLSYKNIDKKELTSISNFLAELSIENISEEVKKNTIYLRKNSNLKLPDSIIAATSMTLNIPLVTSDKKICNVSEINTIFYEK
jgi:predicted nucleic acid-binding protein